MEELIIGKDDYGFAWNFTVSDADGNAFDLTDYTVTIKIWAPTVPGTLLADLTCTKDVPASGTCHWTTTNIFTSVGRLHAELELTKSGVVLSSEKFKISVVESG